MPLLPLVSTCCWNIHFQIRVTTCHSLAQNPQMAFHLTHTSKGTKPKRNQNKESQSSSYPLWGTPPSVPGGGSALPTPPLLASSHAGFPDTPQYVKHVLLPWGLQNSLLPLPGFPALGILFSLPAHHLGWLLFAPSHPHSRNVSSMKRGLLSVFFPSVSPVLIPAPGTQ